MDDPTFIGELIEAFFPRRILFSALLFGAVAGAVARSLVWPERGVVRLLQQGAAGILVAVVGGGYFANMLPQSDPATRLWSFLLTGLVFAILGEMGVKLLQDRGQRVLGMKRDGNDDEASALKEHDDGRMD